MTPTDSIRMNNIEQMMTEINRKLDCLLVPVARQAGQQMAVMTNEERKATNKEVLKQAKLLMRGKA